jgi:DNA-binding NarL/FixJ family response regulator
MNRIGNYKEDKKSLKPLMDPPQRKLKENKIIIIEDDVDFANSLKVVLDNYGYDVFIAVDRVEAIEKVKELQPHIAFVDVRLGRASGFSLLAELKSLYPNMLCVIITAYPEKNTALRALEEGAYDFLIKPFHPLEILSAIDRCLEKIKLEEQSSALETALMGACKILGLDIKNLSAQSQIDHPPEAKESLEEIKKINQHLNNDKNQRMGNFLEKGGLTKRECQIAIELPQEYDLEKIAQQLNISIHTLRTHLKKIYKKLKINSRKDLINLLNQIP